MVLLSNPNSLQTFLRGEVVWRRKSSSTLDDAITWCLTVPARHLVYTLFFVNPLELIWVHGYWWFLTISYKRKRTWKCFWSESQFHQLLPYVYIWRLRSRTSYLRAPFYWHGLTLIPEWISNHSGPVSIYRPSFGVSGFPLSYHNLIFIIHFYKYAKP